MKGYVRPAGHKQGWIENIRRNKALYLFVLPAVIEVLIFNYIPMYGIQIAFRNFKPARGIWGSQWVGLKWFSRFFASSQSTTVIWNTVILSIELLAVSFPLSILFALLVNQYRNARFRKVVQTVSYAPHFYFDGGHVRHDRVVFEPVSGGVWPYMQFDWRKARKPDGRGVSVPPDLHYLRRMAAYGLGVDYLCSGAVLDRPGYV